MSKIFRIPAFKILLSGHGRRETVGDTTYAVYPVVMLVEGIHHGAIGEPVYYPAAVLEASVNEWNGVPVPIHHPQNSNGEYVLCDTPDIIDEWSVGEIRNAHWDGKLKAEVYVDVVRAETKQPGLVSLLDQGNPPMEVSTGLTGFDDGQPGEWNSENHSASITQIFPDHLALLPGGRGACSQTDGCGIRANQKEAGMKKKKPLVLLLADAKAGDKLSLQELFSNELSHEDVGDKLRNHVDSLDVRGTDGFTKYHYVRDVYDDFFVYMERTDEGSQLLQQSYSINADDELVLSESIIPVKEKTEYIPIEVNKKKEVVMERGKKANDGQPCCPKKVAGLIANEHSPYTADDEEFLNSWDEGQLDKALALVSTAEGHVVDNSTTDADAVAATAALKANADTDGEVTLESYLNDAPVEIRVMMNDALKARDNQKGELVATIMANELNKFTEPELKAMEVSQLEGIMAFAVPEKKSPVYTGQGGGFTQVNQDEEVKPYVPVHLNMGPKKPAEADN